MKVIIDCCADEEYNPEFEFETFDKNAQPQRLGIIEAQTIMEISRINFQINAAVN